jgi:hypothetical protein
MVGLRRTRGILAEEIESITGMMLHEVVEMDVVRELVTQGLLEVKWQDSMIQMMRASSTGILVVDRMVARLLV